MNICLFTPSFLPDIGGMEVVLDKLARQFQLRGHKPVVVAQQSRHNTEIPQLPYDVVYYPRPRSAVWLLQCIEHALLQEYKKRHFDIVHSHQAYPTGYIACKLRHKLDVPVVITSHKGDITPEGRYRKRFITRKRMCWALEQADAVTGVSSVLRNIIDELTSNKANSFIIPNGVDVPADVPGLVPEACAQIKGKEFMLTLCRIHRHKGIDVLIDAVKLLSEQGATIPYLVIAGDGKERGNLRHKVADLHLDDKVIFCGAVWGDQKHWLLRNCKFFLQPSRVEGMPLTVLEAMAYGKAVIGTKISGIGELVTNEENGLLVKPGDSVALSKAILTMLRSNKIDQMQQYAKAFVSQMTWPLITDRYLKLYKQLSE